MRAALEKIAAASASRLSLPLRWFRGKLSSAVGWLRPRVGSSARLIRSLLPRAVGWLRAQIKSPGALDQVSIHAHDW